MAFNVSKPGLLPCIAIQLPTPLSQNVDIALTTHRFPLHGPFHPPMYRKRIAIGLCSRVERMVIFATTATIQTRPATLSDL